MPRIADVRFGQISGAQALRTSGADVIAGLAGAMRDAKRARDMRSVSFLGAGLARGWCKRLHAPRKIPRDSPAALPRAQKKVMSLSYIAAFPPKSIFLA